MCWRQSLVLRAHACGRASTATTPPTALIRRGTTHDDTSKPPPRRPRHRRNLRRLPGYSAVAAPAKRLARSAERTSSMRPFAIGTRSSDVPLAVQTAATRASEASAERAWTIVASSCVPNATKKKKECVCASIAPTRPRKLTMISSRCASSAQTTASVENAARDFFPEDYED